MPHDLDTNYFVCTLGQATVINEKQSPIDNINEFIDYQGQNSADLPAVGFPLPGEEGSAEWTHQVYTFQDIWKGSAYVAEVLKASIKSTGSAQTTVALLCPSTSNFLFVWLGLIRLGHAVLLIAPQCQPAAISHLCRACGVTTLFYDDFYQELAKESVKAGRSDDAPGFEGVSLLIDTTSEKFREALKRPSGSVLQGAKVSASSVGYLHHTSGTSTGLPKPIPQTHYAGLGVLPRFSDGSDKATFTTTPLYHGGVADTFRAWTGNAMIWLFPGKGVPITAKNIVSCLKVAENEHQSSKRPSVKYFASVPYVLQMMAADVKGLQCLKSMDIVGVGGAALPAEVGDDLVNKDVHLISRFGSAECGFIMSSHRNYSEDKEWQYLRSDPQLNVIKFEEREDGNSELIVLPSWPHRAKTNRNDGSFASADLFAPHHSLPNAWRYHSRSDSQLTLITGKKFDPAPLESAIATSNLIEDVLIFGNGRPFPGALLFPSAEAESMSPEDLVMALAPAIEKLNAESQDHARLPRNMLVPMAYGDNRIQKSSKGTILRGKAEETYDSEIEAAYTRLFTAGIGGDVQDADVATTIQSTIEKILGSKVAASKAALTPDTDLFTYGVDSVASIQIRYTLKQLIPADADEPPLSIVEDCGSIGKLAKFVLAVRHGEAFEEETETDELQLMQDLVREYSDFRAVASEARATLHAAKISTEASAPPSSQVVILTGATGALGAHILHLYRQDPSVAHIYCLVRGATPAASLARVSKSLAARNLAQLTPSDDARITVLQCSLGAPLLGLEPAIYARLAATATTVMHLAWAVNFRMRLSSFRADHLAGLRNLLALASASVETPPPAFAFCSSVASVSASACARVEECIETDPRAASPLGYSRSKWVAEGICAAAAAGPGGLRVGVFRVGQLAGDTVSGAWNANEAYPLMLASVRATGCLPGLDEAVTWLPVDVAARAMVEGADSLAADESGVEHGSEARVFHVLNPHATPSFTTLLAWLQTLEEKPFEVLKPKQWVERMQVLQDKQPEHPALRLLGLWRNAYGDDKPEASHEDHKQDEQEGRIGPVFAQEKSKIAAPVLRDVGPVSEDYFGKLWGWIVKEVVDGGKGEVDGRGNGEQKEEEGKKA